MMVMDMVIKKVKTMVMMFALQHTKYANHWNKNIVLHASSFLPPSSTVLHGLHSKALNRYDIFLTDRGGAGETIEYSGSLILVVADTSAVPAEDSSSFLVF